MLQPACWSWWGLKPSPPGSLKLILSLKSTAGSPKSRDAKPRSLSPSHSAANPAWNGQKFSTRWSTRSPGWSRLGSKYFMDRPGTSGASCTSSVQAEIRRVSSASNSPGITTKPSRRNASRTARSPRGPGGVISLMTAMLHRVPAPRGRISVETHAPLHRKEAQIPAVGHHPPEPLRVHEHRAHRERAQQDHVPGPVVGEVLAHQEEERGADQRTLQGSEAADHHDEDRVGGPVDAEAGVRRDAEQVEIDQRAGDPGAEGDPDVDRELDAEDIHAQRVGAVLAVPDRHQPEPVAGAQEHVHRGERGHAD